MEGRPLAAAKKQLLESLQSLESVHQFHIIFFNTKTQALDIAGARIESPFASDRNKKLASNFVGGITADGGTDRMVALREAINLAPGRDFSFDGCRRTRCRRAKWPSWYGPTGGCRPQSA